VKTLALVAKKNHPEAPALANAIKARFPDRLLQAEAPLAAELGWPAPPADFIERADLVVVLGGDGTLIHAARLLRGAPVPILGINLGSLGFMTEIRQPEMLPMLETVLSGKAELDSRMKLSCRLYRDEKLVLEDEVLNDVVINKGALARIADHELVINNRLVTVYKSDGVIVATPTGSTAYSLSAGGPIVHPSLDCVVINPICPHALTQRPIVLPGDKVIKIGLKSESADVYLTIDGQIGHSLQHGDRVEVERSANRVLLVKNPQMDYYGILRQKLRWGER
jgi:NAD+ kinase